MEGDFNLSVFIGNESSGHSRGVSIQCLVLEKENIIHS